MEGLFFKRYVPALVGFIAYNLAGADLSIKESWKHAITASVSASKRKGHGARKACVVEGGAEEAAVKEAVIKLRRDGKRKPHEPTGERERLVP